jgi:hypothetical protein
MSKDFVKCSDCWRQGIKANECYDNGIALLNSPPACRELRKRKKCGLGCKKGVTTAYIIEAITEEIASNKVHLGVKAARLKTLEDATDKLIGKCHRLERHKKWLELQQKEQGDGAGEHGKTVRVNFMSPPHIDEIHKACKRAAGHYVRDTAESILNGIGSDREKYIWTSNPSVELVAVDPRKTSHTKAANKKSPAMATYLCENCQEPVIVPKDMLKDALTFKCMTCHQVNHYDLS